MEESCLEGREIGEILDGEVVIESCVWGAEGGLARLGGDVVATLLWGDRNLTTVES